MPELSHKTRALGLFMGVSAASKCYRSYHNRRRPLFHPPPGESTVQPGQNAFGHQLSPARLE